MLYFISRLSSFRDPEPFEWYYPYETFKEIINDCIAKEAKILIAGCGNSHFMEDMVEDGFARLITEGDMQRIDEIFEEEINKEKMIDPEYFFARTPVIDAINNYLHAVVSNK